MFFCSFPLKCTVLPGGLREAQFYKWKSRFTIQEGKEKGERRRGEGGGKE